MMPGICGSRGYLVRQMVAVSVSLLTLSSVPSFSTAEQIEGRPKIGLVLSGGGARGAAHVGVIKVMDELRIPVDYIAGTSMGAIVGSLYASGMPASELEQIILTADWPTWLSDDPPRARRTYRRKTDDFGFLVDIDIGVDKSGLLFPRGFVQGQNFTMVIRRWLSPVSTIRDFDQLPIPFKAIATDLVTGNEVILDQGDLPTAIRASMSAPGIFKPVRLNNRLLVDGGIANNLPVAVAKEMGADVLIVVDVGFPLVEEEELDSALAVTGQIMTILMNARTEHQKTLIEPGDVVITPSLNQIGSQSFDQSIRAMQAGEAAARLMADELQRFSLSAQSYADHRRLVEASQLDAPIIDRVVVENDSKLSSEALSVQMSNQIGKPLDMDLVEEDIANIYGFDTFETVDYSVHEVGDKKELHVKGTAKSWGPNYLRFGINLEDDFDGGSSYNLATRITRTEMNSKGGEFRADLVIGEDPQLAFEFYQPLDFKALWFLNPRVSFNRSNLGLFASGDQIAQFRSEESQFSFSAGLVLNNWGELRLTVARSFGDDDVRIGDPALGGASGDATNFELGFGYDTIDRIAIPRFGTFLQLNWLGLREGFGADQTADIAQLVFLKPQTWGKNTFLHWWDFGSVTKQPETTSLNAFRLGGLFSLSGFSANELAGDHRAVGRLLYYRRLSESIIPLLNTSAYVGASLEMGNVWQDTDDISFGNTLTAGSVFLVFDSVIGPLYLAYGLGEGGQESAYLFLGQTF